MANVYIHQVSVRRFAWVVQIPWLPAAEDDERFGLEGLDRGYLNLAEAVANSSPTGSSVQLRVLGKGASASGDKSGTLSAWLVGSAATQEDCIRLWELTSATLPTELPSEPGSRAATAGVLRWITMPPPRGLTEIRRRIENARPTPGVDIDDPIDATVLGWDVAPNSLRTAMGLLTRQPGRVCLVLHMQRAVPSEALMLRLAESFHLATSAVMAPGGGEYGPLLKKFASEAQSRLRLFPRGALHLRIALAGDVRLRPGLAEAVGMDLTAIGGFEMLTPDTAESITDALALFTEGVALDWAVQLDPELEELRYLATPAEAALVVRFPQPPRGGLPGINSAPLITLPKSPQPPPHGRSAPAVTLGDTPQGGEVTLTLPELNQHCLIAGLPGFGKTNTVHVLLHSLWNDHQIPFLVLDPAKSDYVHLVESLNTINGRAPQRVVLGPETMAFNPFVVPPGSTVAAHAGRMLGAFDAALQISAHWPAGYIMLTRGIFRAYENCSSGEFPTLRSVYAALGDIIRSTPMDPKSRADVTGSLLARLESMVRGPLGSALIGGTDAGIDWADMLSRPTVIEFRGFAGPTERSLIFGLLIAGLASVREGEGASSNQLRHMTVLEEAHRVLSDHGSVEAEGVRLLAEAIAELRGSGEGFVVVDQTPTVLHPTVRKVCGSVIAHRLVEREERETVGSSLMLDDRQIDDLARLPVGRAVVYAASRDAPAVVEVGTHIRGNRTPADQIHTLTKGGVEPLICVGCTSMCLHQEEGQAIASRTLTTGRQAVDLFQPKVLDQIPPDTVWCAIAHLTGSENIGQPASRLLAELHRRRQALIEVLRSRTTT